MKLRRYEENPILTPRDNDWERMQVRNPAAWYDGETVHMLYSARAVNNTIYLGYATSTDGYHFERIGDGPWMAPPEGSEFDSGTVEDARMVRLDDTYYVTYMARSIGKDDFAAGKRLPGKPDTPTWQKNWRRAGLLNTHDFISYERLGPITSEDLFDANVMLFPEKVSGRYATIHRPSDFPCTPHIDRLAAEGVRFSHAFTCYPVCTPARYSLVSGVPVHEHGGFHNHSTPRPGLHFFPQMLAAAGYRTAAVGKMHYTPTYLDVGFQDMCLAEQDGDGRWDDDYHRSLRERGLVDRVDLEDQRSEYRREAPSAYWETFGARESDLPEEHHSTTWVGDRAVDFLEYWTEGGNLLMVGFIKPHHPFDPPAPWSRMYDPAVLTLLPGWAEQPLERDLAAHPGYFPHTSLTETALRGAMAGYYATISQIDHHVGRMLDLLATRGILDRTMVIFTADHGEYMGFHHLLLKGGYLYDPLTRVPLIVRWPGGTRPGTVDERLVSCLDLPTTILRRAGLRPPEQMHGLDLAEGDASRHLVCAERRTKRPSDGELGCQVMVRSHTRKLIRTDPPGESLFFDLERDPHEFENVFDRPAYAAEIREFEAAAENWLGPDPDLSIHLDERAPRIDRPNVPDLYDGHREDIADYFRRAMRDSRPGAVD